MTTSGTSVWNLDIADAIEESYERAGLEARTGYDYRTARRSLNIMSAEWSNRGLNLWTVQENSLVLTPGTKTYTLPADTIDIIETIIRVNSNGTPLDYTVSRIGVGDYATLPNKNSTGRPLQIYVDRQVNPNYTLWPVPDLPYTIIYWTMRRIEDATNATDVMDMPVRFVPALVAGLAFQLAMKRPEAAARVPMLKAEYMEQFQLAADEDRGREPARFVPWMSYP
jgi:hypothetical protein